MALVKPCVGIRDSGWMASCRFVVKIEDTSRNINLAISGCVTFTVERSCGSSTVGDEGEVPPPNRHVWDATHIEWMSRIWFNNIY